MSSPSASGVAPAGVGIPLIPGYPEYGGIHLTGVSWCVEQPRAGKHYPRSVGEFQAWFRTDADCLDYPDT